jgi:tRNA A-37 threonylcarbamoyl transferase component Bud32
MASLEINPPYRTLLERQGLTSAGSILALPALVVSGHPDRNVSRVTLGCGPGAVAAFLKCEHRVRWRDRLVDAWDGFGLVSRSYREALTLRALRQAGVGCPDWIAVGSDDRGRAFLLLEEPAGTVDLPRFLREHLTSTVQRRRFARRLGDILAHLHGSGFDHPDLYSKHVLVEPCTWTVYFLDWQRSRRRSHPGWRRRLRDLAALNATVADNLASTRDRLACLRAYLQADRQEKSAIGNLQPASHSVRRWSEHLLRKRHVREARLCPVLSGTQGVLRLDGEALCVTHDFWTELRGRLPGWLGAGEKRGVSRAVVPLPGGRKGLLVRRREDQPLRWLWLGLRCRPLVSPELRRAGELFRLQRQGLPAPRLLAFGQRHAPPWRTESFLLTEIGSAEDGRSA